MSAADLIELDRASRAPDEGAEWDARPVVGRVRLWENTPSVARCFLIMEDGVSLFGYPPGEGLIHAGPKPAGVVVDETGDRREVVRKPSVPLEELAEECPRAYRAAFLAAGLRAYRSGHVPAPVAELWHWRRRKGDTDTDRAWWAEHGLSVCADLDAETLDREIPAKCGRKTLEVVTRQRSTGDVKRSWSRLMCRSHRCKVCAPVVGGEWCTRIIRQLERDKEAGRAEPCLMTLSVNRAAVENSTEAMQQLAANVKRFMRQLRGLYGDLAYFQAVECHRDGWPHVHLILRCAALNAAMLRDSKCKTWGVLQAKVMDAEGKGLPSACGTSPAGQGKKGGKGKARRCPFPGVRSPLNALAVACGLGETGFYLAPVLGSFEAVGRYVTKAQFEVKTSQAAAEMTKTVQIGRMPRNFRRFRASRVLAAGDGQANTFFCDEPGDGPATADTLTVAIIDADVAAVRAAYRDLDVPIHGDFMVFDRRGAKPADGENWPKVLAHCEEGEEDSADGPDLDGWRGGLEN